MKRKLVSTVLTTAMIAGLLAGCGGNADSGTADAAPEQDSTAEEAPAEDSAAEETPADDGAAEEAPAEDAAASGEAVTLKWAIWDKDITPYWNALKDAYEAANPNVTIEMTDLGSTDYMTVLATELSGSGSDFDVVTIKDVPGYATLVSKNTLEPLDSYISEAGIDLAQYGGVDKQVTVDGSLYELPFRNDFWVVFYNKNLFDAAGVDYPTNDMTFDEYDALARQLTDTTFGSQVYGAHYHTWRSAVQLFGVLDGKHSILDGEYDSSLCGNWGIVKYPHAEGVEAGSTLGTITGLAVTSVSEQKDAAFDFVEWVSGAEGAKVMAETGNFPALMNDELSGIISGLEGFPTDDASKEALTVSNLYLEVPYAENVSAINDILDTYHKSIMNQEITIDEGIAAMNEEVGKILAE